MIKILTICIAVFCLGSSCNNSENIEDNATQNNAVNHESGIAKLNDVLKKHEEPSQIFKVASGKPTVVKGRKGTKMSINPNDLITVSGKPLGQTIEIELKELMNQVQLLSSNTQTVSDGKLIVSGGAYFIGMTSNGEEVKLKEGKKLNVEFPKISENKMELFYGQRNNLGQINWLKTAEIFKEKSQEPKPSKDSVVTVKTERKSEIDAITDYVNSGDTTTTQEERAVIVKQKQEYKLSQKVYDEIGIDQFGWINCDRFLETGNNTALFVNFNAKDSIQNASVFLVFKDINSVIQSYYYADVLPKFENIPIGYKARLIAYTIKNEKVFAYSTDLKITSGQKLTLDLKEINEAEFKKLIGK